MQVIQDGFTYRDQRYTNLLEIARVITGSRWSGPLFFGIRRTADKSNKVAAHGA